MRSLGIAKIVAFYLSMAALGVAGMLLRDGSVYLMPAEAPFVVAIGQVLAGVAGGLLLAAASRVALRHFGWARRLTGELRCVIGPLSAREILVLSVCSSLGEEALFRGVLQPMLGLWLAAAAFAAFHVGPNRHYLPWPAMAFGAGLLFGALFAFAGGLLAPLVAHATVNYVNLRALVLEPKPVEVADPVRPPPVF